MQGGRLEKQALPKQEHAPFTHMRAGQERPDSNAGTACIYAPSNSMHPQSLDDEPAAAGAGQVLPCIPCIQPLDGFLAPAADHGSLPADRSSPGAAAGRAASPCIRASAMGACTLTSVPSSSPRLVSASVPLSVTPSALTPRQGRVPDSRPCAMHACASGCTCGGAGAGWG